MKFLIGALFFAATAAGAAPPPVSVSAADIGSVDASWNELRLKGDSAGLAPLLAEDWMLTHSDGRTQHKSDYLRELGTRTRTNGVIENADVKMRTYGNTVVVTGTSIQSGVTDGKPWEGRFRFTRVWIKQQDKWQMIASHSSRVVP